jgi:hypothetical protein
VNNENLRGTGLSSRDIQEVNVVLGQGHDRTVTRGGERGCAHVIPVHGVPTGNIFYLAKVEAPEIRSREGI